MWASSLHQRATHSEELTPRYLPSRMRVRAPIQLARKNSLKTRQLEVVGTLDKKRRTIKTARSRECSTGETPGDGDSFDKRFDRLNRKYSHRLLGEVKLHSFAFTMAKNPDKRETYYPLSTSESPLPEVKSANLTRFVDELIVKREESSKNDRNRRAMSSIKHFKKLKMDRATASKLAEMIPNKPFGQKNGYEFMRACKEGDLMTCCFLLKENRWLAQARDHVNQTGLHWAARRNNAQIASVLLEHGSFVDARDIVNRTPLHIACRKSSKDVIRILIQAGANPNLKTNAGYVAKSQKTLIQSMLSKSKAQFILRKFKGSELRDTVLLA